VLEGAMLEDVVRVEAVHERHAGAIPEDEHPALEDDATSRA
jgi:hypothetical protein